MSQPSRPSVHAPGDVTPGSAMGMFYAEELSDLPPNTSAVDVVQHARQHPEQDIELGAKRTTVIVDDAPPPKKEYSKRVLFFKVIRHLYSGALLAFAIAVVMTSNDKGKDVKGPGARILFWVLIAWLAVLEGGQNALVGLQSVDKSLYAGTHRVTLISTKAAHLPGNMERFIVGRQLLVVVVVFVLNLSGQVKEGCSTTIDMAGWVEEIACKSSLAVIFVTIMMGQLTSQINASTCLLDFINNYVMVITTYISLAVEFSGLLHAVYLLQMVFGWITGNESGKSQKSESKWVMAFLWGRILMSVGILAFCLAAVMSEIVKGRTKMWAGVPGGVSVLIFFLLMCFVGMMEGMQIALFAVLKMDQSKVKTTHPVAHSTCQLAFRGSNLQKFLVGRQICVTLCMFVVARITTINVDHHDFKDLHQHTLNVNDSFQKFIDTGLLGALITTIIGSLCWRVVASESPLLFLSNPLIMVIIRLCILLEKTGIMHFSWTLAKITRRLFRLKKDNYYLNKARQTTGAA